MLRAVAIEKLYITYGLDFCTEVGPQERKAEQLKIDLFIQSNFWGFIK